ncbi:MAG: putative peptidoglycan lipid flippase, partial [Streptomyces sp.]|nr:putative peptidoglycan lipid flippase [Streptomyces sp.]
MTATPPQADGTAAVPGTRSGAGAGAGAGADSPGAVDTPRSAGSPGAVDTPRSTGTPGAVDTPRSTGTSGVADPPGSSGAQGPAGPPRSPGGSGAGAGERAEAGTSAPRGFLAKAALVTVGLSIAGALLGLGRDQALARLFGAGSDTDAFLVAWTVPEFAATLLIEDGLAFVLVPMFSRAVARRARGAAGDPVRAMVTTTLPRLSLAFAAVSALMIAGAPYLVKALAPGLPDPGLAVDCTRLTATCVLSFGLAGYCSAALRAHRRFVAPAAIYVAYNTGIIAAMFVLGGRWGVRSAAVGVAVGGALMVAAQLPALWRQLRRTPGAGTPDAHRAEPTAAREDSRTLQPRTPDGLRVEPTATPDDPRAV